MMSLLRVDKITGAIRELTEYIVDNLENILKHGIGQNH